MFAACVCVCETEQKYVLQKSLNSPLIVSFLSLYYPPSLPRLFRSLFLCGYYSVTHWNVGRYGIIFRLPDSFCQRLRSQYQPRGRCFTHEPVALETLHKREWESGMPLADWETRWQISLFLSPCRPCIFLLHLVLYPLLNTSSNRMCQNTGALTVLSCHVLN